jgi:hypothetical protein
MLSTPSPPAVPAATFPVGACLHGTDGRLYQVNTTSRSARRWLPCGTSADTRDHLLVPVRLTYPSTESQPCARNARDVQRRLAPLPCHDVRVTWDLEQGAYTVACYVRVKDLGAFRDAMPPGAQSA